MREDGTRFKKAAQQYLKRKNGYTTGFKFNPKAKLDKSQVKHSSLTRRPR